MFGGPDGATGDDGAMDGSLDGICVLLLLANGLDTPSTGEGLGSMVGLLEVEIAGGGLLLGAIFGVANGALLAPSADGKLVP